MRILVLGGSVFLSKATAGSAVARGHEVTCVTRGRSGRGTRRGRARGLGPRRRRTRRARDRGLRRRRRRVADPLARAQGGGRAGRTRTGCSSRPSTSTATTRRPTPASTARSSTRIDEDRDLEEDPEAYGPMKVACEQMRARRCRAVDGGPARADRRTGRPDRALRLLARAAGRGRRVLARRRPDDACRSSTCATSRSGSCAGSRQGTTGAYDGIGAGDAGRARCWPQTADGVGAVARTWCGRPGVPDRAGRRAVDGAGGAAAVAAASGDTTG